MNFPARMISWLSPDTKHPGWRRSPQAQSSQVRFMRTLLVSPDFIADEIPATGGHRRFVLRQGGDRSGPATGDIALLEKADKLRLPRWGYEKLEGFWPKKAREHPRGKVNFPLRMIPRLSPDAKHPGWRLRRRARSTTEPSQTSVFFSVSAGTDLI